MYVWHESFIKNGGFSSLNVVSLLRFDVERQNVERQNVKKPQNVEFIDPS
jgi:hypothetical protein